MRVNTVGCSESFLRELEKNRKFNGFIATYARFYKRKLDFPNRRCHENCHKTFQYSNILYR